MKFNKHKFGFDTSFDDLHSHTGLTKLHNKFLNFLKQSNANLATKLEEAYAGNVTEQSALILELSSYLTKFITKLFDLATEGLQQKHLDFELLYKFKRQIIQRKIKKLTLDIPSNITTVEKGLKDLGINPLEELEFAKKYFTLNEEQQELVHSYCLWAIKTSAGANKHAGGVLFKEPQKVDADNLVKTDGKNGKYLFDTNNCNTRWGFKCSDPGVSLEYALDQAHYCIKCHFRNKDSCSKGLKDNDGSFKINQHKITLSGCPLEVKISEMNILKAAGNIIASLATIMIDNPMLPATGNRICNDCMKSCIYQKQDPVDIPSIESRILRDVLDLPYGFEIYSLLTRWNPLNFKQPLMSELNGTKVLVVGLGPAGFTMAYYLAQYGYQVVAIDGMKLEPLNDDIKFTPIKDIATLSQDLSIRASKGFGGVAEYGITVRWNKNNLDILRLLLARRKNIKMFGSVRYGGTITTSQAKQLGFKHIALCVGAGKPNIPAIANALAPNVRTASDFLMALQTTGAFRKDNLANLQIRMPIVVIGGGLTAVDTATEALIYYMQQVEKIYNDYQLLGDKIFDAMNAEEKSITEEFLNHAAELKENSQSRLKLLREWGGAKILYRKKLQNSPAYRLNHEELAHALKEGVEFVENINPQEIITNVDGKAIGVKHEGGVYNANTIFLAIGTQPNTVIAQEESGLLEYDEKFLQAIEPYSNKQVRVNELCKPATNSSFVYSDNEISISAHGDLHKSYAGNVVKAIASSKNSAPYIHEYLQSKEENIKFDENFYPLLQDKLTAKIKQVNRLTTGIVELIVYAPLAAQNFKPGQFYRLQNYEVDAPIIAGKKMTIEPLALTGADNNPQEGLISLIILEMSGSSDLCSILKSGQEISLMGPTGSPSFIPKNKKVLLIGGGLGNAVLFSIAHAMRDNNCEIIYFAGYRNYHDRFKQEQIEKFSDHVVWCCDQQELTKSRDVDISFHGNMVEALSKYAYGEFDLQVKSNEIEHILMIGSDGLMKACAYAICHQLADCFKQNVEFIASINSPMQCMMKEICAQCLAKHVDPITGEVKYVFSCFNQDQDAKIVDYNHLSGRLKQNSIQEKITAQWLKQYLKKPI